jgi:hypothetical protein
METVVFGWDTLDRMVAAVELVRDRLRRAANALGSAGIPYAVVGGNAVAAWVSSVDPAAVRNTADVDILLRRVDFPAAKAAFEAAGFVHAVALGIDVFLDGPGGRARDAVHILYAGEKAKPEYAVATPDLADAVEGPDGHRHIALQTLVTMKLNSFRRKDQVHLLDFIGVGLIDETWPARFPPVLAARLRTLLADPDG